MSFLGIDDGDYEDAWNEANESACDHGITYPQYGDAVKGLTATEVRQQFPRLSGLCPKGCGYNGIYYASFAHYLHGDW